MSKTDNRALIVLGIILIGAAIYFGLGKVNISQIVQGGGSQPLTSSPNDVTDEYSSYNILLMLNPNPLCAGNEITGTITSNIPNGVCSIWFNRGLGWTLFSNVNLDSSGYYQQRGVINATGAANFRAVCCDDEGRCKMSNSAALNVIICNNPPTTKYYCCLAMGVNACYEGGCPPAGVEINRYDTQAQCQANCVNANNDVTIYCDDICQDNGYDGGLPNPVTDSHDCTDIGKSAFASAETKWKWCCCYGFDISCDNLCKNAGYASGGWEILGPDFCSGIYETFPTKECCCETNAIGCTDSDNGNIFLKGNCVDKFGTYGDYCYETAIGGKALYEYKCVNGACTGGSVTCPYMQDACSDGACWNLQ